jgi:hypothetical protein
MDGPTPAPAMSGAGLSFLRERQKSLPRTGLATLSAHTRASVFWPRLAIGQQRCANGSLLVFAGILAGMWKA